MKPALWALAILLISPFLLVAAVSLVGGNSLRSPLARYVAARTHRPVQLAGPLEIHLLARNPGITAQNVTLGNPPWMPPGTFVHLSRLSVTFELPWFTRPFAIHRLQLQEANLHLRRTDAALANWQWRDPRKAKGLSRGPLLIRNLAAPDMHVDLIDERRHLNFKGIVSAQDPRDGGKALRIVGTGQLNGRPAAFALDGQRLSTVSRARPYHFAFAGRSSDSRLTGVGFLLQPLDVRFFHTTFQAHGSDLKDLYFLTGLRLLDTGPFRMSGTLSRRDKHFRYDNLKVLTGHSDLTGTISIDASSRPAHLVADFQSRRIRLSDLGARAEGRAPASQSTSGVLSHTPVSLYGIRRRNSLIHYKARELQAGKISLHAVAAEIRMDRDVLDGKLLSAKLAQGDLLGRIRLDASSKIPLVQLNFSASGVRLAQFKPAQPPVDGMLSGRVSLRGRGVSVHDFAASAEGSVTATLSHGTIRKSLAELAGLNLRGVGLVLTQNQDQIETRCARADLTAHRGTLTAQTLLLDTEPVLIDGTGSIDLDAETIDLAFRGHPKHMRLRLRAPLTVQGTFRHPVIGVAAGKSMGQAAGAVALGVLLTPLAATLALIDPGRAKDADCSELAVDTASVNASK